MQKNIAAPHQFSCFEVAATVSRTNKTIGGRRWRLDGILSQVAAITMAIMVMTAVVMTGVAATRTMVTVMVVAITTAATMMIAIATMTGGA
jgi:hypothetical protein